MGNVGNKDSAAEGKSVDQIPKEDQSAVRDFVEHLPDVAWVKDDQFRYRYINPAFASLFDIELSEILGREDYDFMPKETADKLRENDRQVLAQGEAIKAIEDVAGATGGIRRWSVYKYLLPRPD